MIPWFIKFIKNCSKKHDAHSKIYAPNFRFSLTAYDELFQK